MQQLKLFLLISILLATFSCSDNEQNQTITDKENAYQEYKDFVIATEQKANSNAPSDLQERNGEISQLNRTYITYESAIMGYYDNYGPERKDEIQELRNRYDIAVKKYQDKFGDVSRRYQLRQELLGLKVETDDMSTITAGNLAATYKHFVNTLDQNKEQYSSRDWEMVEGWWNALKNRKEELKQDLTSADKSPIAEAEQRYLQIRQSVKLN